MTSFYYNITNPLFPQAFFEHQINWYEKRSLEAKTNSEKEFISQTLKGLYEKGN